LDSAAGESYAADDDFRVGTVW